MKTFNLLNSIIAMSLCIMFAINTYIIFTYAKLQAAQPLENLRSVAVEPIFTNSDHIVFHGKYDREVSCTLLSFHMTFTNVSTGDTLMLDESHIVKQPKPDTGPGKEILINFSLKNPKAIYEGKWRPVFTGNYTCKNGIFHDYKTTVVRIDPLTVMAANWP